VPKNRLLPLVLGLLLVLALHLGGAVQADERGHTAPQVSGAVLPPEEEAAARSTAGCHASVGASQWAIEWIDTPKLFLDMRDDSLALDADGHPHIAYGGDHLYYAYHDGTVWHLETVDADMDVGIYASLELDAQGRPHIGYYSRSQGQLKYAYYDGTAWQIQVADPYDGMG